MALRHIVRTRQRPARSRVINLANFDRGLNSAAPAYEIDMRELAELVNLKVAAGGKLEKRPGIQRYTTSPVTANAQIAAAGAGVIGTQRYEFVIDENHRLYYLNTSLAPVFIGTVSSAAVPQIMGFNGVVLILDGSYVKYLDSVSALKILYDDGDGANGYQFDNRAGSGEAGHQFDNSGGSDDTTLAIGDGSNTRAAYRFTSLSWAVNQTIAPTRLAVKLSAAGSPPTGAVTANLRKVSDDTVLATAELVANAANLPSSAQAYAADLVVTTEMSPRTAYYLSIEYTGGDATNHVKVHCTTVAAGGHGYSYNGATWAQDATKDPIAELAPGYAYIALGDGNHTRVAYRFTSQSWDAGFTIPPTSLSVQLSKTGNPATSAITARLRKVSDDTVLATAALIDDASTLTTTDEAYTADFVVTTEMSPGIEYYLSIEHEGGDSDNFVNVHCSTVSSGGHGYHYTGSAWVQESTLDPMMALKPGRPPKAEFGTVWRYRAWVVSPDQPGRVYFSSYGHKDWSTPASAGWVGAIDDDAANYEVGAIDSLYGDLLIYGKKENPYLGRLSGSGPADFAFRQIFQRLWSTARLTQNVVSDLWSVSEDGVAALSGVQEYGDLRSAQVSDQVRDRLEDLNPDTAFSGYYHIDGQFWLVQPGYHRVLVAAVTLPAVDRAGGRRHYPFMEYELYRDVLTRTGYAWEASAHGTHEYYLVGDLFQLELMSGALLGTIAGETIALAGDGNSGNPYILSAPDFITVNDQAATSGTPGTLKNGQWGYGDNDSLGYNTVYYRDDAGNPTVTGKTLRSVLVPTCMANTGQRLLLGGSDGYLYTPVADQYLDQGLHGTNPRVKTAYIQMPFAWANIDRVQLLAASRGGLSMTMSLYTNGREDTPTVSWPMAIPVSDHLTLEEASAILADSDFYLGSGNSVTWSHLNVNAHSFQLRASDIRLYGPPVYLTGWHVNHRMLQR